MEACCWNRTLGWKSGAYLLQESFMEGLYLVQKMICFFLGIFNKSATIALKTFMDAVLFSVVHYLLIKNVYILDTFNFQECMNLEKF